MGISLAAVPIVMQLRLSGGRGDAFESVPLAELIASGRELRAEKTASPVAIHDGERWRWGSGEYARIDVMGPITVEFRDARGTTRESAGPFPRVYLLNTFLFHGGFVLAAFDHGEQQGWRSISTGRTWESLCFKGSASDSAHWFARRRTMIAEAAYYNAERRGFQAGGEWHDWVKAEKQVDAQLWYANQRVTGGLMPMLCVRARLDMAFG
jgi:DUF2934 family protein